MSLDGYLEDALKEERDSALRHVVMALRSGRPNDVAWWMCANHARFIIDHSNLVSEADMIEMAKAAGTPPKGGTWETWFDRVRKLKPRDALRTRS
jgi:hypothetical protein